MQSSGSQIDFPSQERSPTSLTLPRPAQGGEMGPWRPCGGLEWGTSGEMFMVSSIENRWFPNLNDSLGSTILGNPHVGWSSGFALKPVSVGMPSTGGFETPWLGASEMWSIQAQHLIPQIPRNLARREWLDQRLGSWLSMWISKVIRNPLALVASTVSIPRGADEFLCRAANLVSQDKVNRVFRGLVIQTFQLSLLRRASWRLTFTG